MRQFVCNAARNRTVKRRSALVATGVALLQQNDVWLARVYDVLTGPSTRSSRQQMLRYNLTSARGIGRALLRTYGGARLDLSKTGMGRPSSDLRQPYIES